MNSHAQLFRCLVQTRVVAQGHLRCNSKNLYQTIVPHTSVRAFSMSENRSISAPSFSTTGSLHTCVTKLDMTHIAAIGYTGRTNNPLPTSYNIDIDEFLEGSVGAVEVVTKAISEGNYSDLEGLVSEHCIAGLHQQNLQALSEEQQKLLAVNSGDIFLRWATKINVADTTASILLVTFSLPELEDIKGERAQMQKEHKDFDEGMKELVKEVQSGAMDKADFRRIADERMTEVKEKRRLNNYHKRFKETDIVIGNYLFTRSGSADWIVTEISQVNSSLAWHAIFKFRWKGRLGIHITGNVDFMKVLRWEYITDYVATMLAVTLIISSLLQFYYQSSGAI